MKIGSLLAVVVAFVALGANADTCVWTGGGTDAYWSTEANWQDGRKPTNGDSVVIEVSPAVSIAIMNDIAGLSLVDLRLSSEGKGCNFEGNGVSVSGKASIALLSPTIKESFKMALDLAENSECVVTNLNTDATWEGNLTGKGSFTKRGTNGLTVQFCDNSAFEGDFIIEQGSVVVYSIEMPFGTGTIYIYGKDKTLNDSNGGTLQLRREITLPNDIHMWHHCALYAFRAVTLNGNLTCHTGHVEEHCRLAPSIETISAVKYYGGIAINGKLSVDPDNKVGRLALYTFDTNNWIRFAGGVDLANTSFYCAGDGTFYVASDVEPSTAVLFPLVHNDRLVFEKANALPSTGVITFGSNKTNANCVVDLNGYDQTCGIIYSLQPGAAYGHCTNNSQITSSSSATISMTRLSSNATLPDLNGAISAILTTPETATGKVTVSMPSNRVCTMSGRLDVGGWTQMYLRSYLPNISELGIFDKCTIVMDNINGVSNFNTRATIDVHDLDTSAGAYDENGWRTRGYLSVSHFTPTTPLYVTRVYANHTDYPARTYQREKNGAAAGGVFWMQSGTGRVTVQNHDYHWVWTGGGDGTTIEQAANWGTNASPATALAPPVLDFRNGAPAGALSISCDIALAGIANANSTISIGGSGTIAMSGTETNAAAVLFAGSVGVAYSGTGRQIFSSGVSTTTGSLAVNSGEVAFADGFDWGASGTVSIASPGKLDLGTGVAANAKALYFDGNLAYSGIWGATGSTAHRKSDVYFLGTGSIRNHAVRGLMIIAQ